MRPQKPRFFFGCASVSTAITMSEDSCDATAIGASLARATGWGVSAAAPEVPTTPLLGYAAASCPESVKKLCSWQYWVGAAPRAKYSVMTRSHALVGSCP